MMTKTLALAGLSAIALSATAAWAEIEIRDAYARAASPMAMAGAAFMEIVNTGDTPDRLIAAKAGVAKRVELHTHIDAGDGVMKMREVEGGFEVPAQETTMLQRGGNHVMFMGLTERFEQGKVIPVTLVFEQAGEIEVEIEVDLERQPDHGGMNHGSMDHGMKAED